jgi:hypothetical protein
MRAKEAGLEVSAMLTVVQRNVSLTRVDSRRSSRVLLSYQSGPRVEHRGVTHARTGLHGLWLELGGQVAQIELKVSSGT